MTDLAEIDAEVALLAALPPAEYERKRLEAAARLDLRAQALDRMVGAARSAREAPATGIAPAAIEPWPEPVDATALLDDLAGLFKRHVALADPVHADALALWVVHTHAIRASAITPRLVLSSPTKACGKSTLLDLLSFVVARPLKADNLSAAGMFRAIAAGRPTLLIDEYDSFGRHNEALRNIVNSGHGASGAVVRFGGRQAQRFTTFCAVALAAIGAVAETIESRAIVIPMRRRLASEETAGLPRRDPEPLIRTARQCARWAHDHESRLAAAQPALPATLANRAADNWRPLQAIAELAGKRWTERALAAGTALMRQ